MTDRVAELIDIIRANITTDSDAARRSVEQAQSKCAFEFGSRRGWRWSQSGFVLANISSFSKRELDPRWNIRGCYDSLCVDHPFYFRDARGPVAIAAHLYNGEDKDARVIAFANQLGLAVRLDEDFPSWWYPGQTRLVVYTRVDQMIAEAKRRTRR